MAYYSKCYEEFSVCLITNTDNYNPYFRNEYRLIQFRADEWCESHSSSLAIITNKTVQSALEAFINDWSAKLHSEVITYGFRDFLSEWRWITNLRASEYFISVFLRFKYMLTQYVFFPYT